MRLLSIGYPLPNRDIYNHTVFNAPSFFDYDVVYIDPQSITDVVRRLVDEGESFQADDGRAVLNGATTASAVSAADQIRRRADEAQRLLEAGGVIIVAGRPNATQAGVIGFEGCDRYSWLPAPPGMSWSPPFLRAADGKTVRITADSHPFGDFLRDYRRDLVYRATFDDRQGPFRQHGRVVATAGAGAPIAVEFDVLAGRVLFIPALARSEGATRSSLAAAFIDCARRMLGEAGQEDVPSWTRSIAIPGLEQVDAELEEARKVATAATARLATVQERHDHLAGYRRILWQDGRPFGEAVAAAFRQLGFSVFSGPGEPLVLEDEGARAFVEAASTAEEVVEWPYVHLQRRLEEHLLGSREQLKGIVVVNGYRNFPLDQRKEQQFTEPLRIACENYGYTLVTGETLFALVQRALGGAGEDGLTALRRRLMRARGLLDREGALGGAESQESGPIF